MGSPLQLNGLVCASSPSLGYLTAFASGSEDGAMVPPSDVNVGL